MVLRPYTLAGREVSLDCGCHTAEIPYRNEEERQDAARRAVHTWNIGKVISSAPGE